MTVAEFIVYLQTQPQGLHVAYRCCSEQVMLDAAQVTIYDGCEPRPDGWIQSARPDKPLQKYLMLPGN